MNNILFSAILLVLAALSASAQTAVVGNIFDGMPSNGWDLTPGEPVKAAPGAPAVT